jgi:hypothetical protein
MLEFNQSAQVIAHYKLLSSSTGDLPFEGYAVKLQPSVTSGKTEILYNLPEADAVQLRLMNAGGQVLSDLHQQGDEASGRFSLSLDLQAAGLPAGMYFIQFRTKKGFVQTMKVVLQ